MKNKKFIFILVFSFIFITILAFSTDTKVQKVHLKNQNFNISQENANFTNKDFDISLSGSDIKNQDINSKFSNVKVNNDNINYKKHNVNINSESRNSKINFKNQDINQLIEKNNDQYSYQSVSWNEWRSNFIDRFLDDSIYLTCLDEYGLGSWFYYSFEVTKYGNIENIKIFSFYLKSYDKEQIKNLIKSYAYQGITKFPPNSKRMRAKVKAIVLLGDAESKAKPSDFNDYEKVKVKN